MAGGRIGLEWETGEESFQLTWRETGAPPLARPTRSGYGIRYVRRALKGQFGEEPLVEFHTDGLVVVMRGPLSRIVEQRNESGHSPLAVGEGAAPRT